MERREFLAAVAAGAAALGIRTAPVEAEPKLQPGNIDWENMDRYGLAEECNFNAAIDQVAHAIVEQIDAVGPARLRAQGVSVPFATEPLNFYVHRPDVKLPRPVVPAQQLIEIAAHDRLYHDLLTRAICRATRELINDYNHGPPSGRRIRTMPPIEEWHIGDTSRGAEWGIRPQRIVSCRYTWDVDDARSDPCINARAIRALVCMTWDPLVEFIRMHSESKELLAMAPPQLYLSRRAFMVEMFTWTDYIDARAAERIV